MKWETRRCLITSCVNFFIRVLCGMGSTILGVCFLSLAAECVTLDGKDPQSTSLIGYSLCLTVRVSKWFVRKRWCHAWIVSCKSLWIRCPLCQLIQQSFVWIYFHQSHKTKLCFQWISARMTSYLKLAGTMQQLIIGYRGAEVCISRDFGSLE